MTDSGRADGHINVTIKRNSKKKAGFEVERRNDGCYYITKVPKNCTKIGVGDRVLEINGTMQKDFKSQKNANELVDTIRLDVAPVDDHDDDSEDDSEEEYEEMDRSKSTTRNGRNPSSKISSGGNHNKSRSVTTEDDSGYDNDGTESGRASVKSGNDETWDRAYVSKYKAKDRFMISVTRKEVEDDDDLGVDFVEFDESEIYVSDVNKGPFYDTALNRGDKILSINGKKIPQDLSTVEEAMDILYSRPKMTLFVLRPMKSDEGYNWVHEMYE